MHIDFVDQYDARRFKSRHGSKVRIQPHHPVRKICRHTDHAAGTVTQSLQRQYTHRFMHNDQILKSKAVIYIRPAHTADTGNDRLTHSLQHFRIRILFILFTALGQITVKFHRAHRRIFEPLPKSII